MFLTVLLVVKRILKDKFQKGLPNRHYEIAKNPV
jgi:hypothetical protein